MRCKGCIAIKKPFWGDVCSVKACCEKRKEVHCGLCPEFPCDVLTQFSYDTDHGDNGERIKRCRSLAIYYAYKLSGRAYDFYRSADYLRTISPEPYNVVDYCSALSFELKLKSILLLRGKFSGKLRHHRIDELFKKCEIKFKDSDINNAIKHFNVILNDIGRYSVETVIDRERLDGAVSTLSDEIGGNFGDSCKKSMFQYNYDNFIEKNVYKDIWEKLCNEYNAERERIDFRELGC
jgi:hypothetical protein